MNEVSFKTRERNFGDNRYKIMLEFLNRLTTCSINDIYVEDICKAVGLSKVTFFKYFSSKEVIVFYFIKKWEYDRSYEIASGICKGRKGIEQVFYSIYKEPYGLNVMLALIQFMAKTNVGVEPLEITPYEYFLFNEEAYRLHVAPMYLYEIFQHYLLQMNIATADVEKLTKLIISIMHGVPILKRYCEEEKFSDLNQESLAVLFHGWGLNDDTKGGDV